MTSRALARKQVLGATPGECTPGPAGQYACIPNDFFCRLAGRSAPTGKAIVHWIGCINAIKLQVKKSIVTGIVVAR